MTYMRIARHSVVEVHDLKSLLAAWKLYGGVHSIVCHFVFSGSLTRHQIDRLPKALQNRLACRQAEAA
jgi:hypothetical protein